jgi:hypothetical protein
MSSFCNPDIYDSADSMLGMQSDFDSQRTLSADGASDNEQGTFHRNDRPMSPPPSIDACECPVVLSKLAQLVDEISRLTSIVRDVAERADANDRDATSYHARGMVVRPIKQAPNAVRPLPVGKRGRPPKKTKKTVRPPPSKTPPAVRPVLGANTAGFLCQMSGFTIVTTPGCQAKFTRTPTNAIAFTS